MNFGAQYIAELVSLAMTIPTLVLSGAVVYFWGPSLRKPETANDWFITGVVFGFIGAFLDNTYWFIPWTGAFLDLEITGELVSMGVYFNIFFRQSLGIFAAYCHLKAAEMHEKKTLKFLNVMLFSSSVAGILYAVLIIFIKVYS